MLQSGDTGYEHRYKHNNGDIDYHISRSPSRVRAVQAVYMQRVLLASKPSLLHAL